MNLKGKKAAPKGPTYRGRPPKGSEGNMYGLIPGMVVGGLYDTRSELSESWIHRPKSSVLHAGVDGVYSVLISSRFRGVDEGLTITFPGPKIKNNKSNSVYNEALLKNFKNCYPIRVVRGVRRNCSVAPSKGFRFDGLYEVEGYTRETTHLNFMLRRQDNQANPPWNTSSSQLTATNPIVQFNALKSSYVACIRYQCRDKSKNTNLEDELSSTNDEQTMYGNAKEGTTEFSTPSTLPPTTPDQPIKIEPTSAPYATNKPNLTCRLLDRFLRHPAVKISSNNDDDPLNISNDSIELSDDSMEEDSEGMLEESESAVIPETQLPTSDQRDPFERQPQYIGGMPVPKVFKEECTACDGTVIIETLPQVENYDSYNERTIEEEGEVQILEADDIEDQYVNVESIDEETKFVAGIDPSLIPNVASASSVNMILPHEIIDETSAFEEEDGPKVFSHGNNDDLLAIKNSGNVEIITPDNLQQDTIDEQVIKTDCDDENDDEIQQPEVTEEFLLQEENTMNDNGGYLFVCPTSTCRTVDEAREAILNGNYNLYQGASMNSSSELVTVTQSSVQQLMEVTSIKESPQESDDSEFEDDIETSVDCPEVVTVMERRLKEVMQVTTIDRSSYDSEDEDNIVNNLRLPTQQLHDPFGEVPAQEIRQVTTTKGSLQDTEDVAVTNLLLPSQKSSNLVPIQVTLIKESPQDDSGDEDITTTDVALSSQPLDQSSDVNTLQELIQVSTIKESPQDNDSDDIEFIDSPLSCQQLYQSPEVNVLQDVRQLTTIKGSPHDDLYDSQDEDGIATNLILPGQQLLRNPEVVPLEEVRELTSIKGSPQVDLYDSEDEDDIVNNLALPKRLKDSPSGTVPLQEVRQLTTIKGTPQDDLCDSEDEDDIANNLTLPKLLKDSSSGTVPLQQVRQLTTIKGSPQDDLNDMEDEGDIVANVNQQLMVYDCRRNCPIPKENNFHCHSNGNSCLFGDITLRELFSFTFNDPLQGSCSCKWARRLPCLNHFIVRLLQNRVPNNTQQRQIMPDMETEEDNQEESIGIISNVYSLPSTSSQIWNNEQHTENNLQLELIDNNNGYSKSIQTAHQLKNPKLTALGKIESFWRGMEEIRDEGLNRIFKMPQPIPKRNILKLERKDNEVEDEQEDGEVEETETVGNDKALKEPSFGETTGTVLHRQQKRKHTLLLDDEHASTSISQEATQQPPNKVRLLQVRNIRTQINHTRIIQVNNNSTKTQSPERDSDEDCSDNDDDQDNKLRGGQCVQDDRYNDNTNIVTTHHPLFGKTAVKLNKCVVVLERVRTEHCTELMKTNTSESKMPPTRKRGRPRKTPANVLETLRSSNKEQNHDCSRTMSTSVLNSNDDNGRVFEKASDKVHGLLSPSSSSTVSQIVTVIKRGRGRPRRIQHPQHINENSTSPNLINLSPVKKLDKIDYFKGFTIEEIQKSLELQGLFYRRYFMINYRSNNQQSFSVLSETEKNIMQ